MMMLIAQAAPTGTPPPAEPWLAPWQWVLVIVLIVLIVGFIIVRKKQNR
jgi:hypothetical protein